MMNITKKGTITYHATCNICDATGPESAVLADAVSAAFKEGWMVIESFNSRRRISTTICPRCSRASYEARYWVGLEATGEPT